MYVCVCHAVTEKQIRAAADKGATRLDELSAKLGVATGCGCCAGLAKQVLDQAIDEKLSQGYGHGRWYSVA
ncbi:MAG TPA: (2Fe-2S)-binding protein [Gammaproteobacteria bacterium]|nr:(2Fe-2S)-binding protein [Gammaproteobacteria bacterium]